MKFIKLLRNSITIIFLIFLLYTLINSIIYFYQGYHNIDTAFNYGNLGYEADINLDGEIVQLSGLYILGLNQILYAFKWMCFNVILGICLGYSLKLQIRKGFF